MSGNALALLNFPEGTLFNRASLSIFSNSVSYTTISIKTSPMFPGETGEIGEKGGDKGKLAVDS
jgi:hypothetical protein